MPFDTTSLLRRSLTIAQEQMQKFQAELAADPVHAMHWSDGAFAAAAEIDVLTYAIRILENGGSTQSLLTRVTEDVNSAARSPVLSTSPADNYLALLTQKARAQLAERLIRIVESDAQEAA